MEVKTIEGLIADKGLSLEKFALMLNISRQTLQKKLENRTQWKMDEVDKVCKILGISIEEGIRLFLR